MILFPAIDILGGRAVRLLRGGADNVTDYGEPLEFALKWERSGAEYLHIVDLDGAFGGEGTNLPLIKEILRSVKIPVQTGGGIRTLSDISVRLEAGAARVILGTSAACDGEMLAEAVREFGSRIIAGIDARDGRVMVRGWVSDSGLTTREFGKTLYGAGISTVVFTDISRDGALSGVNTEACIALGKETGLNIIASGGVSSCTDISELKKGGVYGAIIGKALYTGAIDLTGALKI